MTERKRLGDAFDSHSLGLRAQKKLLSKMASKNIAKVFIDDTAGHLLDCMYKVAKEYTGSKKAAEKIMKDFIKIVIKVGILYRNEQFSQAELKIAGAFREKFHSVAMTVVSFYEVDFTFDKAFLSRSLMDCSGLLKQLVERHLTDKSIGRINHVFQFFGNPAFLEALFKSGQYKDLLGKIVVDLNKLMDDRML